MTPPWYGVNESRCPGEEDIGSSRAQIGRRFAGTHRAAQLAAGLIEDGVLGDLVLVA